MGAGPQDDKADDEIEHGLHETNFLLEEGAIEPRLHRSDATHKR